ATGPITLAATRQLAVSIQNFLIRFLRWPLWAINRRALYPVAAPYGKGKAHAETSRSGTLLTEVRGMACRNPGGDMKLIVVGIGLSIATALAAPAFANWFDGSSLHFAAGHKLLLGSAVSPTPDDLCAIGRSKADRCYTDATRTVRKAYVLNEK